MRHALSVSPALVVALALAAGGAGAQQGTFTDTGRQRVENPIVEFKRAPFRTPATERPELIDRVETRERFGARLRKLDKMTGATETIDIAAGQAQDHGRLRIALETCVSPDDDSLDGTRAFLRVWDARAPGSEPAFSGWMFADSPALSALDHPRFDVWVISCTTS